jgi:hypothetical protein
MAWVTNRSGVEIRVVARWLNNKPLQLNVLRVISRDWHWHCFNGAAYKSGLPF